MQCRLCGRKLDDPNDVLTEDIAGDCIRCMIQEEYAIGDYKTASQLLQQAMNNSQMMIISTMLKELFSSQEHR